MCTDGGSAKGWKKTGQDPKRVEKSNSQDDRQRGEEWGGKPSRTQSASRGEQEKVQKLQSCGSRATFRPGRRDAQQMWRTTGNNGRGAERQKQEIISDCT